MMGWALIADGRLIATGSRAHVLEAGVEAGVVAEARYEATRTGDEVVRYKLLRDARMIPAARIEHEVWRAAA